MTGTKGIARPVSRALAAIAWAGLIACGGPALMPTDEHDGGGGKSGFGHQRHFTPSERTGGFRDLTIVRPDVPIEDRRAVARVSQASASAELLRDLTRAPLPSAALIREAADWHLAMAQQLTAVVGHIEVENAAKATQDFAALRRQVEPLLGPPLEAALLTQLDAIYQQDAADLQQLSASSYAPLRTFAQAALAELQSRRTRPGA